MTVDDQGSAGPSGPPGRGRGRSRGGRRDGMPPFAGGPDGGFGPPRGGPPFGRRPRPRRGDVRIAVLGLLAEQPMHGYQLLTELSARSGGVWRPSPGSIYPMLAMLEDEGLVRPEEDEGRKVFHLTEAGRAQAEQARDERATTGRKAPWEAVADEADDALVTLHQRAHQVLGAAAQVAQVGTADQVAAAAQILVQARQRLYRLLADDEVSEPDEGSASSTG